MSSNWNNCVCDSPTTFQLDEKKFLSEETTVKRSPIDDFYASRTEIIREGSSANLRRSPFLGPLLLVGLVSSTEYFIRRVIADCIDLCEMSRKTASRANLKLGSALWHGGEGISKGVMEHLSLADKDTIRKQIKDLLGYDIRPNSDSSAALIEFAKVCEFRHGIVHSSNRLPGMNAVNLGFTISGSGETPTITIGVAELQDAASVCSTVVTSLNNELFELFAGRWAGGWVEKHDAKKFSKLWEVFYSEFDEQNGLIENSLTKIRCRNIIKRERP